jgi:hypothetical protein
MDWCKLEKKSNLARHGKARAAAASTLGPIGRPLRFEDLISSFMCQDVLKCSADPRAWELRRWYSRWFKWLFTPCNLRIRLDFHLIRTHLLFIPALWVAPLILLKVIKYYFPTLTKVKI